jgi:hypothetical protein
MNWDTLLFWMTHLSQGSWQSFRKAVSELTSSDDECLGDKCRNLRMRLSEMGHADFFVDGTQNWRVRAPILAGLTNVPSVAMLCGGRTPKLLGTLQKLTEKPNCKLLVDQDDNFPSQIRVEGSKQSLQRLADSLDIQYVPDFSKVLFESLRPISKLVNEAEEKDVPKNWSVRSYDLQKRTWIEDFLPGTACEYSRYYGECLYFIRNAEDRLLALSKREAVYAAAMLQRVAIAEYNANSQILLVPSTAPLPEDYSRVACLSSGKPSRYKSGNLMYDGVSPDISSLLLVYVGQPFPDLNWSN